MDAQYNVARFYERGRGTSVDVNKALEFYRLAADQGHEPSLEQVQLLEAQIPRPVLQSVGRRLADHPGLIIASSVGLFLAYSIWRHNRS